MANLPAAGYLSNNARTEGEVKTALESQRSFIEQQPGGFALENLTIAATSVTPTKGAVTVDTSGGATDNLDHIVVTNLPDGSLLFVRQFVDARVVTVRHLQGGSGQISLLDGVNRSLLTSKPWLLLKLIGTTWTEVGMFYGDQKAAFAAYWAVIANALLTTKGDMIAASGASTPVRKPVGSDGKVLHADSTDAAGVAYYPHSMAGTALFQFNSTTQVQIGVGMIPLKIGGVWRMVPITAAITGGNGGLTASTVYYVYAFDSAGTTTLEFSTTTHVTDTTFGVEIKSGDATRTLVGMIKANASSQFSLGLTRSWYVDPGFTANATDGTNRTNATTTFAKTNVANDIEFLVWAGELVTLTAISAVSNNTASDGVNLGIGIDSSTVATGPTPLVLMSATASIPVTTMPVQYSAVNLSEGAHTMSLLMRAVTGGTATTNVNAGNSPAYTAVVCGGNGR